MLRTASMWAMCLGLTAVAHAGVIEVGPFVGDLSEPCIFPDKSNGVSKPLFDGFGALTSEAGTTSIKIELSSTFQGKTVVPINGPHMIGFAQGPGLFEFSQPVAAFGGWINTNSGADNALVEIYNGDRELIETTQAIVPFSGGWTWFGWQADKGIGSMRFTGNGVADGFLWFEEMELQFIPTTGTAAPVALAGLVAARRRRR